MSDDLVKRLRLGACALEIEQAADRIEVLETKLDLSEGALDIASKSWDECQRTLEQTEAKLAKAVEALDEAIYLEVEIDGVTYVLKLKGEIATTLKELKGDSDG